MTQQPPCVIHLEEARDGCGPTLVPVHPSHETSSLDVGSTSVVGDALENTTSEANFIYYVSRNINLSLINLKGESQLIQTNEFTPSLRIFNILRRLLQMPCLFNEQSKIQYINKSLLSPFPPT